MKYADHIIDEIIKKNIIYPFSPNMMFPTYIIGFDTSKNKKDAIDSLNSIYGLKTLKEDF